MKLIHTALGELYQSFSAQELKELDLYLKRQVLNKGNTLIQLHKLYREAKQSKQLDKLDTQYIKNELFENSDKGTTKQTTYTNFLLQHIKEFLILSKIKEKNIYAEALWGELLIERGLKKNLLLKQVNLNLNYFRDGYAFIKNFFSKRERFFYEYLTLRKKNYKQMVEAQKDQLDAFTEYTNVYFIELLISIKSLSKQINIKFSSEKSRELISTYKNSENVLIKLQARCLSLIEYGDVESYYELKRIFENYYTELSNDKLIQLIPILLNYCLTQTYKGNESFELENYNLYRLIDEKNILFGSGISNNIRLFNYIRFELQFGSIDKSLVLLVKSLDVIPPNQKESFQYLIESRIDFAKKNYRDALHKISIVDPKDSIYYYPQYKIMSIMCQVMMGDYDRLNMERDNFYKFIYNHKEVPEDAKRRHKLFIRYAEYLIEARFEHLSDYMHRRIENALLPTSPYFTEKIWVRERWNELKAKFD